MKVLKFLYFSVNSFVTIYLFIFMKLVTRMLTRVCDVKTEINKQTRVGKLMETS